MGVWLMMDWRLITGSVPERGTLESGRLGFEGVKARTVFVLKERVSE